MPSRVTVAGDTFESIARAEYGSEGNASLIARANPGVSEPLGAGLTLGIPKPQNAGARARRNSPAANPSEVSIRIGGKRFRFWSSVTLTQSIDAMSTLTLEAPLDADSPEFRKIFKPLAFQTVEVDVGGEEYLTGTTVAVEPSVSPTGSVVRLSAYSLPGVLSDCTALPDTGQESRDLDLREITKGLIAPFALEAFFEDEPGPVFEDTETIQDDERVLTYLSKLAKQRGLIISSTPRGRLLFHRVKGASRPVARLRQGQSPLVSVTPAFKPQEYHSHIVAVGSQGVFGDADIRVGRNKRIGSIVRPLTIRASSASEEELEGIVRDSMGRMFARAATYRVSLATWRDPAGELWKPNTTITIHAHSAMIYKEYKFLIRSVALARDAKSETAELELVVPGSFDGVVPERMPWDD